MISAELPIGDGHTPLSDEDRQGLRPTYISTRRELYAADQTNIASSASADIVR